MSDTERKAPEKTAAAADREAAALDRRAALRRLGAFSAAAPAMAVLLAPSDTRAQTSDQSQGGTQGPGNFGTGFPYTSG